MSKYLRHQSVVSRHSDSEISEDHWLKQFEKSLQKSAVQPRSVDSSLFDQINSIMNGGSKYPTVESAVEDMKNRSGLTAYLDNLNKTSESDNSSAKTATTQNKKEEKDNTPIILKNRPEILKTIENYVRDTKGNLPVPAIIDKIRSIHQNDVSEAKYWDEDNLIKLISKLNLTAKKNNPDNYKNYNNLGTREVMNNSDIDVSNVDAFHSLNPVKF